MSKYNAISNSNLISTFNCALVSKLLPDTSLECGQKHKGSPLKTKLFDHDFTSDCERILDFLENQI